MRKLKSLLAILWLAAIAIPPASAQSLPGSLHAIPTTDGYQLNAYVSVPTGQGNGPFPVIVMPSSWGLGYIEYVGAANTWANDGYIVVSYASRGFGLTCSISTSCGYIDIAGTPTVNDVSTVIDWTLANTPANPDAIGVSGISYGGGTSLLGAENDPRIKAVAAMSTWADLQASLDANQTPSAQGIGLLSVASYLGKPGPLMQQINQSVIGLNFYGAVQDLLPVVAQRNPISMINQINQNHPAVFLANGFEDSLFVPSQLINFYNQLTVPKYLMFSHGDHATAELTGALGFPNEVYTAATAWFDHYLKGVNNGIDQQSPVQLETQNGAWSGFASWNAVQSGAVTYNLGNPNFGLFNLSSTGSLASGNPSSWQYSFLGGIPTIANSGLVLVNGLATQLDLPLSVSLPLIARANAAVWTGPVLSKSQNLTGLSTLHITVTPSTSQLSLFAYLYSVDPLTGFGQLISWKPYSLLNVTPKVPQSVSMQLEATDWQINAGQQLALVIGTVDLRYAGVTPPASPVSFSSSAAAPSTLTVSLH